ncbi:MAG: SRPBCC family protein [Cyanobacteria bacterium P01_D01_bin.2]
MSLHIPYPLRPLGRWTAALALTAAIALPTMAQESGPLEQLPTEEQTTLQGGDATVSGNDGEFTGRILINAPVGVVWEVVTDYDNFEQFLPSVEASQVLDASGDRIVYEQLNVVDILFITNRSRIVVESVLSYPQHIDFSLVEGDVAALQGMWQLEPVNAEAESAQVLLTQEVAVEPEGGSDALGLFSSTYQYLLGETLAALKQESEQRSEGLGQE